MHQPTSTYRLQFRNGVTFDTAVALVPYLTRLQISHLYASPIFAATPGSTHGYDVTDPNRVDDAIGGRAGLNRLSDALQAAGIGLILDIVPNHMAASLDNPWWDKVVEWGADSPYADTYDIDWSQRLTLPVLGSPLADLLEGGELAVTFDKVRGRLVVGVSETGFPLVPRSYALALGQMNDPLARALIDVAAAAEARSAELFHEKVRALCADGTAAARIDAALAQISADPKAMAALLGAQPWHLCSWKDAASGLSYRRFFEVTGLVGLRVEDEAVFHATHRLVLDLVASGRVQGLRIDHIDGLADPAAYLKRLRAAVGPDIDLLVEKILGANEVLPSDWPVSGTTGYEFITALSNLFVDPDTADALNAAYQSFTGCEPDFRIVLADAKTLMLTENFAGEVNGLVALAQQGLGDDACNGAEGLADCLRAILKAFPVYRTYGDDTGLGLADRVLLDHIVAGVRVADRSLDGSKLDAIVALFKGEVAPARAGDATRFRLRFQQVSGPIMAKSMEDTGFYRFNRLLALNEVGGEPDAGVFSQAHFHALMHERQATQPQGLSATSTHDTKRGEDARARLYAISERPEVFEAAVRRWHAMNEPFRTTLSEGPAPEPQMEWALYQTMIGAWPAGLQAEDAQGIEAFASRFAACAEKMGREAKQRTNWSSVNASYEAAVGEFCTGILSPGNRAFLDDFVETLHPFAMAGLWNALTQSLVKLTAPGVPDIYQGSEIGDFSLVDPDNRRLPDFGRSAAMLDRPVKDLLDDTALSSGASKLSLTAGALSARARHPKVFSTGAYVPLDIVGPDSGHFVAFARVLPDSAALVLAPCRGLRWFEHQREGRLAGILSRSRILLPPDFVGLLFEDALFGGTVNANWPEIAISALATAPYGLLIGRRV